MNTAVRLAITLILAAAPFSAPAQSGGRIAGKVLLKETGWPLHGATVLIVGLGRSTLCDAEGRYEFVGVPPGQYELMAHLDSLFTEAARRVQVVGGGEVTADFLLALAPQRYEVTVTASDKQETAFESFQSVKSYAAYDIAESADVSLGEALNHKVGTGIAKRSFGPGSSRPIIRGFDGDRVLVMEDGIRTGTLSSQSGDHGELINPSQLERLEIVKGPATLLYSGNAMGGTVNAISRHHESHHHPHQGLRGFATGSAGSASALGGGSTGFEYGRGKWMFWGEGGGVRSGDYDTPAGTIFNSRSRVANAGAGFGWFGNRVFFSVDAKYDDGFYGVPFAAQFEGAEADEASEAGEMERIALDSRRQNYRVNWGLKQLGPYLDNFTLKLNYTDWGHEEVEIGEDGARTVGTEFDQAQFIYRGVFEQRKRGSLSGRFGFWGLVRDYDVAGAEALSPAMDQTGFALFGLEEISLERAKLQFGARLETQHYTPAARQSGEAPQTLKRNFTGVSASAGLHADLWDGGALVANYAHSHRAPALEELYNFGPHIGNLAFEVGNARLKAEFGDGVDVSLRHSDSRLQGELNFFYYHFNDFIFPFATGQEEDGLRVIEFTQRDTRFVGAEASLSLSLHRYVWLNLGGDFVDAQDTRAGTPLPRIPPLRGKVGLDFHYSGLRVEPELIVANQQHQTFTGETRTPGYAVFDLKATYTIAQAHLAHQFSVSLFNLGDRLYRNHSSFIKDLAPEIGRGIRFTYMMRLF